MYNDVNIFYFKNSVDMVENHSTIKNALKTILSIDKNELTFSLDTGFDNFESFIFSLMESTRNVQLIKLKRKILELAEQEPRILIVVDDSSLDMDDERHFISITIAYRIKGLSDSPIFKFHEVINYA